jgi:hypothetical protein
MPAGSLNRLLTAIDGERADEAQTAAGSITERLDGDADVPAPAEDVIRIERGSEINKQGAGTNVRPRPLTGPELTLLSALDALIDTPREAKRLFNLYRMIRATRDLSDASRFLGEDRDPGEYEAVVVLLGLLTTRNPLLNRLLEAAPDLGSGIAGGLLHRPSDTGWEEFVADCVVTDGRNRIVGRIGGESVADWTRLNRALGLVSTLIAPQDISTFQRWVPRIRRFSYNRVA